LKRNEHIGKTVQKVGNFISYFRVTSFSVINIGFTIEIRFEKNVAQMFLNCPLLPSSQNNLAGKLPMTQKNLATPLH
jgi:hypothetical protein